MTSPRDAAVALLGEDSDLDNSVIILQEEQDEEELMLDNVSTVVVAEEVEVVVDLEATQNVTTMESRPSLSLDDSASSKPDRPKVQRRKVPPPLRVAEEEEEEEKEDTVMVDATVDAAPESGNAENNEEQVQVEKSHHPTSDAAANAEPEPSGTNNNAKQSPARSSVAPALNAAETPARPAPAAAAAEEEPLTPGPLSPMPRLFSKESLEPVETPAILYAVKRIKKFSPYEREYNAESDEPVFCKMKEYISPHMDHPETGGEKMGGTMHPELVHLLGGKLASDTFTFRREIRGNKKCFVRKWVTGNEQLPGVQMGWVPQRQVLFCLYSDRFADASNKTLEQLTKELECAKAVKDVIAEYKLEDLYPWLMRENRENTYEPGPRYRDCLKAEVFCARAYAAMQALRCCHAPTFSMQRKLHACLSLMEKNIGRCKSGQREVDNFLVGITRRNEEEEKEAQRQPKKSGDRSSSPEGPVREISVVANRKNSAEGGASEASEVTMNNPPNGQRRPRNSTAIVVNTSSNSSTGNGSGRRMVQGREERVQGLLHLYNMVEEQHHRLGQTIALLQDSIQEHRDLCVLEMRNEMKAELLKEMKRDGANNNNNSQSGSRKKSRRSL